VVQRVVNLLLVLFDLRLQLRPELLSLSEKLIGRWGSDRLWRRFGQLVLCQQRPVCSLTEIEFFDHSIKVENIR